MLGAIAGDIIGSPYRNEKADADFPLFNENSYNTEISIMTLAVAEALMRVMRVQGKKNFSEGKFKNEVIYFMKTFGKQFKEIHYGRRFYAWIHVEKSFPYKSESNGAALRVSPIAWAFDNLEDVEKFAGIAASVTHKTETGVNYARAMAGMIFLARIKKEKADIKNYFEEKTGLTLSKTIEDIRPDFDFMTSAPETVSAALIAFLETENFEDAVRKAISLGGETNATASMSGALAEALYGIKTLTEVEAFERLEKRLKFALEKWEQWKN